MSHSTNHPQIANRLSVQSRLGQMSNRSPSRLTSLRSQQEQGFRIVPPNNNNHPRNVLTSAATSNGSSTSNGITDNSNAHRHHFRGVKRKAAAGHGREWMKSCYVLLQSMFELNDSKPFRNPVDEYIHPVSFGQIFDIS